MFLFFHFYFLFSLLLRLFFFNFVQLYTWTQVCAAELSSGRLSSRLRASDSSLMAERNTVLYVPSRHTYLSWKTGYSTPPLHTPRQHYTHTHIHMTHTHTALLWPEVTQRGGDTPCHKETIYTQRHTHIHLAILTHTRSRTHTHTLAHWENWSPNLVWLSNGRSCVYMEPCNLCLSVTAEFCTLIGVQIRCISPLCAPPLWQIGKMCKHQLTTVRNF